MSSSDEPSKKKLKTDNGAKDSPNKQSAKDFQETVIKLRKKAGASILEFKFNKKRVRVLSKEKDIPDECGGLVYWMSRDQRVQDNWAFLYAQKLAMKLEVPLHVCFCLVPKFLEATIRHYGFMLKGLKEVEKECKALDIPFHLLIGYSKDVLPEFVRTNSIGGIIADFCPLRVPTQWVTETLKELPKNVPFCQVDAHNIVPCWEASPKLEYGARTIRKKIHDQLSSYLTEFPPVIKHPFQPKVYPKTVDWPKVMESLEVDRTVEEVTWAKPGPTEGINMLYEFLTRRLKHFGTLRNDPTKNALSNLSPWYHFGQLSVQRAILIVKEYRSKYAQSVDGYIEEAIIRRELSDNFCFYNENYDNVKGAYDWARKTLKDHKGDEREYIYSRQELEESLTHDDLWNAAQIQLVREGKMHGFLRMYWAKKILEWTTSPEVALADAIYLNDRYSMDGRDPNGYVGCMWSICGIHDQGWKERPVFGKIRFMNYKGCQRKFDVPTFVRKYGAKVHVQKGKGMAKFVKKK